MRKRSRHVQAMLAALDSTPAPTFIEPDATNFDPDAYATAIRTAAEHPHPSLYSESPLVQRVKRLGTVPDSLEILRTDRVRELLLALAVVVEQERRIPLDSDLNDLRIEFRAQYARDLSIKRGTPYCGCCFKPRRGYTPKEYRQ